MSDPIPPPLIEDDITLEDVVDAFLRYLPEPTDEQLHQFSATLGIPYPDFEEQVFKMFGEELEQIDDIEEILDDEDLDVDDLDMFLVAFFLYVPEPTEETVHNLADLVGITPEQLEERVYAMLAVLRADDDDSPEEAKSEDEDSDDTDEDSPEYEEDDAEDVESDDDDSDDE